MGAKKNSSLLTSLKVVILVSIDRNVIIKVKMVGRRRRRRRRIRRRRRRRRRT
jgi:hypothetical protein